MIYLTQGLNTSHNRTAFNSGNDMLDIYLKTQANQDINRKLSTCFVLVDEIDNSIIKGYYTLSNNSIPFDLVPDSLQKNHLNLTKICLQRFSADWQ